LEIHAAGMDAGIGRIGFVAGIGILVLEGR